MLAAGELAGPPGPPCPAGPMGLMGEPGPAEFDGLARWDLDGERMPGLDDGVYVGGIWTARVLSTVDP